MSPLTVHHIGYLVKNMKKARDTFLSLGYRIEQDTLRDEFRKVDICFLVKDNYRIELVCPYAEDSVVSGLMKRFKNSPYHICYETADFEAAYAELRENGFIAIDAPAPAPALGGREVVFLSSASLGMIELIRP